MLAARLAQSSGVGRLVAEAASWASRLHLARGDLASASSELDRTGADNGATGLVREMEQVTRARLLMAQGEHDDALGIETGGARCLDVAANRVDGAADDARTSSCA